MNKRKEPSVPLGPEEADAAGTQSQEEFPPDDWEPSGGAYPL